MHVLTLQELVQEPGSPEPSAAGPLRANHLELLRWSWWQLAGSRLSGRSIISEPKAWEIDPHDKAPDRKMHGEALHRRGNPNAKNHNQNQNQSKTKTCEKTLSVTVVSRDMHIRVTILHTQPNGKRLKSDTAEMLARIRS